MGVDEQLDRLALLAEMEKSGKGNSDEIADAVAVHHDLVGLLAPEDSLEMADHADGIVE